MIGFDDVLSAPFGIPSLTTIRQPLRAMGQAGAESLLNRIIIPRPPMHHRWSWNRNSSSGNPPAEPRANPHHPARNGTKRHRAREGETAASLFKEDPGSTVQVEHSILYRLCALMLANAVWHSCSSKASSWSICSLRVRKFTGLMRKYAFPFSSVVENQNFPLRSTRLATSACSCLDCASSRPAPR